MGTGVLMDCGSDVGAVERAPTFGSDRAGRQALCVLCSVASESLSLFCLLVCRWLLGVGCVQAHKDF